MTVFIVDGDKGGVGKSFVARSLADHLIEKKSTENIVLADCDPSNADVVCEAGYSEFEVVDDVNVHGVVLPTASPDDWYKTVDAICSKFAELQSVDYVFSLPAGAGLHIEESVLQMFDILGPVKTVWVMGATQSSADQLMARFDKMPYFYEKGLVCLNEYHGQVKRGIFDFWFDDDTRNVLVKAGDWEEFTIPPLTPFIMKNIGLMPFHTAVKQSIDGEISPTIKIGIQAYRKVFAANFSKAFAVLESK